MVRLALLPLLALGLASRLTAAEKPNIVFIFSDDRDKLGRLSAHNQPKTSDTE